MSRMINNPAQGEKKITSVAIIMDGNGRWARQRGLPRTDGHKAGAEALAGVIEAFRDAGVSHLTLYAFSTENWRRPREEVDAIMELIYLYLDQRVAPTVKEQGNISVRFLGDRSALPKKLADKCTEVENLAKDKPFVCNIALNYGGRDEIVNAVNRAIADGHTRVSEELLSRYMYTYPSPDPDMIIRTGGDFRISNFLLWQNAYSELVITDTLWPDFSRRDVEECIAEFHSRKRRFGGLTPEDE